jgi:hypothetical protein
VEHLDTAFPQTELHLADQASGRDRWCFAITGFETSGSLPG